ncbi:MAG: hypothetical protein AB7W47_17725 [Calditrichaceae bacterium]
MRGRFATVEYTRENETIADSLLLMADESIPRLCALHGLPLSSFDKKKARIILTDAPDFSNGYAVGKDVVIFATSSTYIQSWTGSDLWYGQVLKHELVHHISYRKLRRKLNFFGEAIYLSAPRWFLEGIAQYFTESWNAYRGDLYLKNAVFSGKLNYNSLLNLSDGRLLYAAAHAYVRFLAEQRGDSALINLMSYQPNAFQYDFDKAFKHVYGKSPSVMFESFIRHMVLYYGDFWADYPVSALTESLPETGSKMYQILPMASLDSTYLISARLSPVDEYATGLILQIRKGQHHITETISDNIHAGLVLSPDENFIAYGQFDVGVRDDLRTITFRWRIYNRKTGKTSTVDRHIRARHGVFTVKNDLILALVNPSESVLKRYNIDGSSETIFRTPMPVGKLAAFKNGDILFEAQQENGFRDLFILSYGKIRNLTNDMIDDRNPVILNDSLIVFNRYVEHNPVISLLNLNDNSIRDILTDQFEYWIDAADTSNQTLIVRKWDSGREEVFESLPLDTLFNYTPFLRPDKPESSYGTWTKKEPVAAKYDTVSNTGPYSRRVSRVYFPQNKMTHVMSFALPAFDEDLGAGIYGMTSWMESLQRQMFSASFVIFPDNFRKSLLVVGHSINLYNLRLFSGYYHGPVIFSNNGDKDIEMYEDIASFGISRRNYIHGNHRLSYTGSVAYQLNDYDIKDPSVSYTYHGPELSFDLRYLLPTSLYPAVPKKEFGLTIKYFKSVRNEWDFDIRQADLVLGHKLFAERLGFRSRFSAVSLSGQLPPLQGTGIDRFYEYDFSRDFRYTKSLPGIREDIIGKNLVWNFNEVIYFLQKNSSLKLLFIPVKNIAVSGFYGYANVSSPGEWNMNTYGGELSFGGQFFRAGFGYASARVIDFSENETFFIRLTFYRPDF